MNYLKSISRIGLSSQPSLTGVQVCAAAIAFVIASGTWLGRPYGISYADLLVAPVALGIAFRGTRPLWPLVFGSAVLAGVIWSPAPEITASTAARIFALGIIATWIYRRDVLWPVLGGSLFGYGLQFVPAFAVMFDERTPGIAPTISILGVVGFAAYSVAIIPNWSHKAWFDFSVIGAFTIAASGARAPLLATVVLSVLIGRRWAAVVLLVAVFVFTAWVQGNTDRVFDIGSVVRAGEVRMASAGIQGSMNDEEYAERLDFVVAIATDYGVLIDDGSPRPIIDRIRGVGAGAYHAAIGWPRPHNIYHLVWRELGVFVLVPVSLLFLAWRRGLVGIPLLVALAVYGLMDDSLMSANGHYAIASVVLVGAMARKYKNA